MMLENAVPIVQRVLALHWTIEVDPKERFFTLDVPVIPWRRPTRRDHLEGLGVDNAAELRFPLDPRKMLVMSKRVRRPVIDLHDVRARRANAAMASACHRFIVGKPPDPNRAGRALPRPMATRGEVQRRATSVLKDRAN